MMRIVGHTLLSCRFFRVCGVCVCYGEFLVRICKPDDAGNADSRAEPSIMWPLLGPAPLHVHFMVRGVQWRISGRICGTDDAGSSDSSQNRVSMALAGFSPLLAHCPFLSLLGNSSVDCDTTDSGCNGRVWTVFGTCTSSSCTVCLPHGGLGFKEFASDREQTLDAGLHVSTLCLSSSSSFLLFKTGVLTASRYDT